MEIEEYLDQCKAILHKLEGIEAYEVCKDLHELIQSIEVQDSHRYINLMIHTNQLDNSFFGDKAQNNEYIEKSIVGFFGLNSVFEYSSKYSTDCIFKELIDKINM